MTGRVVLCNGLYSEAEVLSVLKECSLLISTSRSEGFSMSILEAMGCGVPIIAYNCCAGVRQQVTDQTGILVPSGHIPKLSDAMSELMGDAHRRFTLGINALQHVQQWSDDNIVAKWYGLFNNN